MLLLGQSSIVFSADKAAAKDSDDAIKEKLKTKVTFSFEEVALKDALKFVADATHVEFTLDPKMDTTASKINLRVKDMEAETAIKWILRLADCDYVIRNGEVFVNKAQAQ